MYSDSDIKKAVGSTKLSYLANKHRGGLNNQKGATYEVKFVFLLIARAATTFFANSEIVTISVQMKCFVDDAIYDSGSQRAHFQLRDVQALTWNSGSGQPLWEDFKDQHVLNQSLGVPATKTSLVVSTQPLRDSLHKSLPPAISSHSEVILFPNIPFEFLQNNPEIRQGLTELCHSGDSDLGQLVSTMNVVIGHWMIKEYSSVDFKTMLEDMWATNAKIRRAPAEVSPALALILDQIPGFHYETQRGYLSWKYGTTDLGTIPDAIGTTNFIKIAQLIEKVKPVTFEALEGMLL